MGNDRNNKDKEMAARLKREGVRRTVCNCPVCHNLIALAKFPVHVYKCPGRRKG